MQAESMKASMNASYRKTGKVKFWAAALAMSMLAGLPVAFGPMAFGQDQGMPDQAQGPGPDQGQGAGQAEADPPTRVARIGFIEGTVSLQTAGSDQWADAQGNFPMSSGDRIYTDTNGRSEIQIGAAAVRLSSQTDLTVTDLTDQFLQLGLAQGSIRVRTFGLNPGDGEEIDTPNGAITVTKPGDIRIDSYTGDGGTVVTVNSGEVSITGPGLEQTLAAGMSVRLMGTNPIDVAEISPAGYDDFDTWSMNRDRRYLDSQSSQYVSRDMVGYEDLDEYGGWEPAVPEYGAVWYPRAVAADWVPYRTGYWSTVGPWGYTWVDSEPWGFAPFHYGRWAYIGTRWGWIPGPIAVRPVYSPALVAFAGGGGFSIGIGIGGGGVGLSAWFPLGPRDPYIPWYHCSPRYVTNVNVTNVTVVNRTYVTNVVNNYNVNHESINTVRYTNQSRGFTAVPAKSFASGQSVSRNIQTVPPAQIAAARANNSAAMRPAVAAGAPRPTPPGLRPAANVSRPVTRPTVMTSKGLAPAVPHAAVTPFNKMPPNSANRGGANAGRPGSPNTGQPSAGNPGNRPGQPAGQPGNQPGNQRPAVTRNGSPANGGNAPAPNNNARPGNVPPNNGGMNRPGAAAPESNNRPAGAYEGDRPAPGRTPANAAPESNTRPTENRPAPNVTRTPPPANNNMNRPEGNTERPTPEARPNPERPAPQRANPEANQPSRDTQGYRPPANNNMNRPEGNNERPNPEARPAPERTPPPPPKKAPPAKEKPAPKEKDEKK